MKTISTQEAIAVVSEPLSIAMGWSTHEAQLSAKLSEIFVYSGDEEGDPNTWLPILVTSILRGSQPAYGRLNPTCAGEWLQKLGQGLILAGDALVKSGE